jgi:hypothetical protein
MLQIATEFGFARSPPKKYQPKLNFFLPKINWEEEKKHALRGWTRS